MGICIAFEATIRKGTEVGAVLAAAEGYAIKNGWLVSRLTGGLRLEPGRECETIDLFPDNRGTLSANVKTQFAGPAIHREVIGLLDQLQPLVQTLDVVDDSEFWESRDQGELEEAFESTGSLIAEARHRLAPRSLRELAVWWLRLIGICIGGFLAAFAVALLCLWISGNLGA